MDRTSIDGPMRRGTPQRISPWVVFGSPGRVPECPILHGYSTKWDAVILSSSVPNASSGDIFVSLLPWFRFLINLE